MTLQPLSVCCPTCGSADVLYSCKPDCCFNHVCNGCYTTFELETERIGEIAEDLGSVPEQDPTAPTAPCARCGECRVFEIAGDADHRLACSDCRALLRLALVNVAAG